MIVVLSSVSDMKYRQDSSNVFELALPDDSNKNDEPLIEAGEECSESDSKDHGFDVVSDFLSIIREGGE